MAYLYNNFQLKNRRRNLRNEMSKPEQVLWYWIRNKQLKGYKFRRQTSISNYILDFYCPELRLGIEVDGDSHFENSEAIDYDKRRSMFISKQNIKIIRFTNSDIMNSIEGVIEEIFKYLP